MRQVKFVPLLVLFLFPVIAVAQQNAPTYTVLQASITTSSSLPSSLNFTAPVRDLLVQNNSDTDISCDPSGATAAVGAGVVLKANGGYMQYPNYLAPVGGIACIHGGTGTKLLNVIIAR